MKSDLVYPTYHTLLIALDRYPLGYRSLYGCVNDIDGLWKNSSWASRG